MATKTRKSQKPPHFFIAMMGPGETGQGMAFAKYAKMQGAKLTLATVKKEYLPLVTQAIPSVKPLVTENSHELKRQLKKRKPDILVLCNAKIFTRNDDFHFSPPVPHIPSLSIDSNWLFFKKSPYPSVPWADKYCLNFPEPVFKRGLKKYGGHYSIEPKYLKKIELVGLLPSYRPIKLLERTKIRKSLGIKSDEKLVFLYTSLGYLVKPVVFEAAINAVRALRAKGRKIKVVFFGDKPSPKVTALTKDDLKWLMLKGRTDAATYARVLASSDLVFQHQGLGTLEQAIGSQVPVISVVRDAKNEKFPKYHRHAWEVGPFARYGAAKMFYFDTAQTKVNDAMDTLLHDRKARATMRDKQHRLYSKGEQNVYKVGLELIKKNK